MNDMNNYQNPQGVNKDDSTQITRSEQPVGNTSHPIGIAAAVVGSMLMGGGVAYAISRIWPTEENGSALSNTSEPVEAEQEQVVTVVEDHVVIEHRTASKPSTPSPAPHDVDKVEFVGTHVEQIDGEQYVVGEMRINGETVYMVDTDHDGVFDRAGCDSNHNNIMDSNEVISLPTEGPDAVTVAQFQIASGEPVHDLLAGNDPKIEDPNETPAEDGIELLGIHETYDEDGNPITIAGVRVDGIEVAMIDVDNDGVFDLIAHDIDGDGNISESEISMMQEPVTVSEVAELPHADDYSDDFDNGNVVVDDSGIDATYDDGGMVSVSEDFDDSEVEVATDDDEAAVTESDDAMECNMPIDDGYEEPEEPMVDDFGVMDGDGVHC